MSEAAREVLPAASPAVEEAVLESFLTLYREPDVQQCLLDRAVHDPAAGPYRAYRRKEWEARDHWVVSLADEHVEAGGRMLVVGCGAGRMCVWLAQAGFRVTGIDIVPEFIEAARHAVQAMPGETRPDFLAVEGYHWPAGEKEYDGVAMMATFLTHCPTTSIRARLFSEAYRVLRPGGCVLAEAADRSHPAFRLDRQLGQPAEGSDEAPYLQALRGLPGVVIGPLHPFRFGTTTATSTAWYFADPRELWQELEAARFRVIRLQTEQNPTDRLASVTAVASKDRAATRS
jgi:SAM-dependent methyltransferase